MVYIVENNGVYGLTKGQFSATADKGSKSKRGVANTDEPLDMIGMALLLGATYVARSFSGDKKQLVPLIKGAIEHQGAAFIDVISPCVAFNNHAGLDQELRLRARSTTRRSTGSTSSRAARRSPPTTRRATVIDVRAARRLGAAPAQARAGLRSDRPHQGDELPAGARRGGRSGDRACSTSHPDSADLHEHLNTVETPLNQLDRARTVPGQRGAGAHQRRIAVTCGRRASPL